MAKYQLPNSRLHFILHGEVLQREQEYSVRGRRCSMTFPLARFFMLKYRRIFFPAEKTCVPTQAANPHRQLEVKKSRPCTSSNSNAHTDISSPIAVLRGILYINCASTPPFSLCSSKTFTSTRKSSVFNSWTTHLFAERRLHLRTAAFLRFDDGLLQQIVQALCGGEENARVPTRSAC